MCSKASQLSTIYSNIFLVQSEKHRKKKKIKKNRKSRRKVNFSLLFERATLIFELQTNHYKSEVGVIRVQYYDLSAESLFIVSERVLVNYFGRQKGKEKQ